MNESPVAFDASGLCLACGLCCNGTLFSKVRLGTGDDADRLRELGFPVNNDPSPEFAQPCLALGADCCCRIYGERPGQCRKFECALLTRVSAGKQSTEQALSLILSARSQAQTVRKLLRRLGNFHETQALSLRYQTTETAFRGGTLLPETNPEERAEAFAELTLAVYRLQAMLRQDFYA